MGLGLLGVREERLGLGPLGVREEGLGVGTPGCEGRGAGPPGAWGRRGWDVLYHHSLPPFPDDAPVPAPAGDQKEVDASEKKLVEQLPEVEVPQHL